MEWPQILNPEMSSAATSSQAICFRARPASPGQKSWQALRANADSALLVGHTYAVTRDRGQYVGPIPRKNMVLAVLAVLAVLGGPDI